MGCSTTLLTDKDGSDIGQFLYTPFGEFWVEEASEVDIDHITRFFTNQQYDKESGLYYYNARYYDPHLGSFITPDPAKDGLNHYAYANSNPIKYTDPTGLITEDEFLDGPGIGPPDSVGDDSGDSNTLMEQAQQFWADLEERMKDKASDIVNKMDDWSQKHGYGRPELARLVSEGRDVTNYLEAYDRMHQVGEYKDSYASASNKGNDLTPDVVAYIYRNKASYNSVNDPKYASLDFMIFINKTTHEIAIFNGVQTVANYPGTYKNTLAEGDFFMRYSSTSKYSPNDVLVINNAKTVDQRIIDNKGMIGDDGRWLLHANRAEGASKDWAVALSAGCQMPSSKDVREIMNTLSNWNVPNGFNIPTKLQEFYEYF